MTRKFIVVTETYGYNGLPEGPLDVVIIGANDLNELATKVDPDLADDPTPLQTLSDRNNGHVQYTIREILRDGISLGGNLLDLTPSDPEED